jgi:hypothetical protein
MAKTKVSQWSATPANNTDIANIDIAEGCAPSGINNAIREIMAQVKDMQTGADGDDFNVGGDLYVADDATIADTLIVQNATIINGTLRTDGMHFALGGVTGNVTGNVSGTSANVTGTVAVANGGTGLTTLTANNLMLGNGTSSPTFISPDTNKNILESDGTTWASVNKRGVEATPGDSAFYGARAWVNFDGSVAGTNPATMTIRQSNNVASVTRTATGNYTVTFTTPMPDANYCVIVNGSTTNTFQISGSTMFPNCGAFNLTTTSFNLGCIRVGDASDPAVAFNLLNAFVVVYS